MSSVTFWYSLQRKEVLCNYQNNEKMEMTPASVYDKIRY